jgi:molybdopterin-binding protein
MMNHDLHGSMVRRAGLDGGSSAPRLVIDLNGPRLPGRTQNRREGFVKLSARNILKGTITEVKKGQTTTHVLVDIGEAVISSSITNEAADELKLAKGQSAYAVIKASDVMIGID